MHFSVCLQSASCQQVVADSIKLDLSCGRVHDLRYTVVVSSACVTTLAHPRHDRLVTMPDLTLCMLQRMDEVVAMYYTMELLRTVAELHRCQILHTDLKPDNLLMRNDGSLTPLHAAGLDAWRTRRGLILCDFGRAVDLALLPEGTTFLVGAVIVTNQPVYGTMCTICVCRNPANPASSQ